MSKDSFVSYRSFHEALKELTREQYGNVMFAINEYALNQVEIELTGIEKMAFTLIKPQLDANIKRQENGKYGSLGGRPRKDENPKQNTGYENKNPMGNFSQENKNPNENLNANENLNVNVNENERENSSPSTRPVLEFSISQGYAKQVFELLKENKLPCCNQNEITFMQTDFKFALETLHNKPELRGIHSNDVLGAIKNYASVINNPNTWHGWKNRKSFDSFVSWDRFRDFLPDRFCIDNFLSRETVSKPRNEQTVGTSRALEILEEVENEQKRVRS